MNPLEQHGLNEISKSIDAAKREADAAKSATNDLKAEIEKLKSEQASAAWAAWIGGTFKGPVAKILAVAAVILGILGVNKGVSEIAQSAAKGALEDKGVAATIQEINNKQSEVSSSAQRIANIEAKAAASLLSISRHEQQIANHKQRTVIFVLRPMPTDWNKDQGLFDVYILGAVSPYIHFELARLSLAQAGKTEASMGLAAVSKDPQSNMRVVGLTFGKLIHKVHVSVVNEPGIDQKGSEEWISGFVEESNKVQIRWRGPFDQKDRLAIATVLYE